MDREQKIHYYSLVLREVFDSIARGETFVEDYPELKEIARLLTGSGQQQIPIEE